MPGISVVVTCHNYGHFLEDCLASLAAQSRPADQVIVVDDGSTDASRTVLARHAGHLTVISQANRGQAGAFNAGFARVTGDLVLFLDADDTLAPDALETLEGAWHDTFACLSFGLALIDAAGRPSGAYPIEPAEGDLRPELLVRGHFRFMPTSGNILSVRRIAPGFPLPEPRWRISADAVLLRIAALAGPIRALPLVLGNYRAHGGNAYHRNATPEMRFLRRATEDMADAALALADLPGDTLFGPDPDLARLQLVLAFVRLRLALPEFGGQADRGTIGTALRRLLRLRVGLRAKAGLGLALALVPPALLLLPASRGWVSVQDRRPRWLEAALAAALGASFQERRRALSRPRWARPLRPGQPVALGAEPGFCNAFDWRDLRSSGRRLLCHPMGEILVALPHRPHGVRLSLELRATEALAGIPLAVALALEGEILARTSILGEGRIAIVLEPPETLPEAPLRLRLFAGIEGARPFRGLQAPAALLEAIALSLEDLPPPAPRLLLGLGEVRQFAEAATACQIEPAPDPGAPGSIPGTRLLLGLVRPPAAATLVLRFGPAQVPATVIANLGDGGRIRARIGPGGEARIPLAAGGDRALDLSLEIDPLDPLDDPGFDLVTLGLVPADPGLLAAGEIRVFSADPDPILGEGWTLDPGGALLFETLGRLDFALAPSVPDAAELCLQLAPAEPLPPGAALALVVSAGCGPLAQVRLVGEHELAVPLAPALADGRRVALALHAVLLVDRDGTYEPRRGALRLRALRLAPVAPAPPAPRPPARRPPAAAAPATLAAELLQAREAGSDPVAARDRVLETVRALAPGAVNSEILDAAALDRLLILAAAGAEAGPASPCGEIASLRGADPAEAGRALALAILSRPPWDCLAGRPPGELNPVLRAFPTALARHLCATDAPPHTGAALAAYRRHVLAILEFARQSFLAMPRGNRDDQLAEDLLLRLHPHPLLFAGGSLRPLALARSRAIEAWLVSRGHRITLPRSPRATGGRIRLGILLRHLGEIPETWILRGTIGQLDRTRFDCILFLIDPHAGARAPAPDGMTLVDLSGTGIAEAVEAIRAAALDALLLGTFFLGLDRVAAIAAHRLAPLQLATTAVWPMTTGLRSVDVMLSGRDCEPPDAAAHYTERLVCADGPVQGFAFGPPPPRQGRALTRARLGLPAEGILLTSGAALGKIGGDLLQAWVAVLASAPQATLVLYPFARNWLRPFGRSGFERRIADAAAAQGVDPARILLLDSLEHAAVQQLLAASDLYLDSFPYSGATTVVEALRAGLPAVALAGDNQRGLQGAAWLRTAGLGGLVAATPAAYVATAARLAGSEPDRTAARAAIRLPPDRDPGRRLGALLRDLAGIPDRPEPRYLFHHLPKAGGTSCRAVLADWFTLRDDDREPWSRAPAPPPLDLGSLAPDDLLCGHFNSAGFLLRERYPALLADPCWRLITFLRDPLETALSYYFFERHHRPRADPGFRAPTLDAYLAETPGHLAEHLASIADDWRAALERYWFVGTLDRLDESLAWLAVALGKPAPAAIPRLNPTPRPEAPSDAAIAAFVRRHAQEFAIYRAAAARAAARLATDPRTARWPGDVRPDDFA